MTPAWLFPVVTTVAALTGGLHPAGATRWGEAGHRITAQAAIGAVPADMPAFFRAAGPQLTYLNPEPDRWRNRVEAARDGALEGATAPDHFIDLEMIPARSRTGALLAKDRFAYADSLRAHGVNPATVGVLPFAIVELTQRLRLGFRAWRVAPNAQVREWIEARILNDAGILGHYVADGSNPAHTTIHYNGWVGDNPGGFATDTRFHGRFESAYVQARIRLDDVRPLVDVEPKVYGNLRQGVVDYLLTTNANVIRLYQLDRDHPFNAETTAMENHEFTRTRLAAGAQMLRDLWWTAWVTSGQDGIDTRPDR
ncbi:MAG: hypothetical protein IT355_02505 [Gemmatimonadaceae bacterium]|nr:hypothetical protein [Gemmatimonadaceae bacterium]